MGMAPGGGTDDGKDRRIHRVYVGRAYSIHSLAIPDIPRPIDLDHGVRNGRHIQTDSSCWLKDLEGRVVRITVEVMPDGVFPEVPE